MECHGIWFWKLCGNPEYLMLLTLNSRKWFVTFYRIWLKIFLIFVGIFYRRTFFPQQNLLFSAGLQLRCSSPWLQHIQTQCRPSPTPILIQWMAGISSDFIQSIPNFSDRLFCVICRCCKCITSTRNKQQLWRHNMPQCRYRKRPFQRYIGWKCSRRISGCCFKP